MGDKGENTRRNILTCACRLFSEKGYKNVSMQDICTASGLSKGGLYRHYGSKDEIFCCLMEFIQSEHSSSADDENLSAIMTLEHYLEHFETETLSKEPDLSSAVYEFCIEHKETVGKLFLNQQFQRGRKIWIDLITAGNKSGEFNVTDPEAASSAILFLMEGVKMCHWVMNVDKNTVKNISEQIRIMLGKERSDNIC